jgi:hypothetical protein
MLLETDKSPSKRRGEERRGEERRGQRSRRRKMEISSPEQCALDIEAFSSIGTR